MKLLLDTHALLWLLAGDVRTPEWLRADGGGGRSNLFVSDVSIWEIAIKRSLGRLDVPEKLPTIVDESGFSQLAIKTSHVWAVRKLEPIHSDPFDRLLVAQALEEGMTLVSSDRALGRYGVPTRW